MTLASSSIRFIVQFFILILLLNIIAAKYERPRMIQRPHQRSAGSNYAYAWFTRDIHDDNFNSDEVSSQDAARIKFYKTLFEKD